MALEAAGDKSRMQQKVGGGSKIRATGRTAMCTLWLGKGGRRVMRVWVWVHMCECVMCCVRKRGAGGRGAGRPWLWQGENSMGMWAGGQT